VLDSELCVLAASPSVSARPAISAWRRPITRLFGREAGILQPALIEEVSRAVRTRGPRKRGDRVNQKASVLFLPSLLGAVL
jgi:hypothetical protein